MLSPVPFEIKSLKISRLPLVLKQETKLTSSNYFSPFIAEVNLFWSLYYLGFPFPFLGLFGLFLLEFFLLKGVSWGLGVLPLVPWAGLFLQTLGLFGILDGLPSLFSIWPSGDPLGVFPISSFFLGGHFVFLFKGFYRDSAFVKL